MSSYLCLKVYEFTVIFTIMNFTKFFTAEQIEKIRQGYYSAVYFNRTKEVLFRSHNLQTATMQVFQKNDDAFLCGIEEVKELLQNATGYFEKGKWVDKSLLLQIQTLSEGTTFQKLETVMHITGPYVYFAHLESIYLGILARRTMIATNVHNCVKAANGKQVVFFADRFDNFLNQEGDGYAAKIGGISAVCTQAMASKIGGQAVGTIPHALIAMEKGDTVRAAKKFLQTFPDVPLIVLADFHNDVVNTSLALAKKFGKGLYGVRLDTAKNLVDVSLQDTHLSGVRPELVTLVRKALNKEGYSQVKIVVSGGFDASKIKIFEEQKTPVDIYGVGSSLLKGNFDFTADIVKVEQNKIAKVGRTYKELRK